MVLVQIIRGSHKIADIRREVRIGKLALAAANAGEIETQRSDVASCKALGDPRSCENVLAEGEEMSEQGESARLRRQVRASRQHRPSRSGKLNLPRFGHACSYLVGASRSHASDRFWRQAPPVKPIARYRYRHRPRTRT